MKKFNVIPHKGLNARIDSIYVNRLEAIAAVALHASPVAFQQHIRADCSIFRRYTDFLKDFDHEVIEQTEHPIGICDPQTGKWLYVNRIASGEYEGVMQQLISQLPEAGSLEGDFDGRHMTVDVMPLPGSAATLIAATDMSDLFQEQSELDAQIRMLEARSRELDETRQNIDAYLETLPAPKELRQRQELIESTNKMAEGVFRRVEENLEAARRNPEDAEEALRANLKLTRDCITSIRSAVAQFRGE